MTTIAASLSSADAISASAVKSRFARNWSTLFESFPDFRAELLGYTAEEGAM
jgi:hypothetical protein